MVRNADFPPANRVALDLGLIARPGFGPGAQLAAFRSSDGPEHFVVATTQGLHRGFRSGGELSLGDRMGELARPRTELAKSPGKSVGCAGAFGLDLCFVAPAPHGLGDLGEVARALGRNQALGSRRERGIGGARVRRTRSR